MKSTNHSQSTVFVDPKFTFIEKLLIRKRQKEDQADDKNVNLEVNIKSLPPQSVQSISSASEIPKKFVDLLELEIFNPFDTDNNNNLIRKQQWIEFARWTQFSSSKTYYRQFRDHCRRLWAKIKHAHQQQVDAHKKPLEHNDIPKAFQRKSNDKLNIADKTTKKVMNSINLNGYKHVLEPQCFKNTLGETIIDFYSLTNPTIANDAKVIVDNYYQHTCHNPQHQSKEFTNQLSEIFGAFTSSTNEPYTTANMASSHLSLHQKCVNDLIQGLQPLSKAVNNYLQEVYPTLYEKMKKLDLGPNVPKSFGAYPTMAINFNTICQFHRDLKDHCNSLCVVCPLGVFEGGELVFPELKLVLHVKQGQAVAFRSNILVHGNLPVLSGVRHSVVFFVHSTMIKQNRKFGTLFSNSDSVDINYNNKGVEVSKKYNKRGFKSLKFSKPGSRSSKLKNSRRSYISKC
jgi:hypothetical protein